MTRRHESLLPLTHDHHHVLRQARRLRLAADGDPRTRTDAAQEFLRFFRAESLLHFREEEEIILPLVADRDDAPTAAIDRLLREHVDIHNLVEALDGQATAGDPHPETMTDLAQLLRSHVRFEEDELFPLIEDLASDELLNVSLSERQRPRPTP